MVDVLKCERKTPRGDHRAARRVLDARAPQKKRAAGTEGVHVVAERKRVQARVEMDQKGVRPFLSRQVRAIVPGQKVIAVRLIRHRGGDVAETGLPRAEGTTTRFEQGKSAGETGGGVPEQSDRGPKKRGRPSGG
jgi:hypothetical protein